MGWSRRSSLPCPRAEIGLGEAALTRISIFMNVFNVHVNRSPAEGEVAALAYRPGRFFNASLDKASEFNERMSMRLAMAAGPIWAWCRSRGSWRGASAAT